MGVTAEVVKNKKALKLISPTLEELRKYNAMQQGKVQYT